MVHMYRNTYAHILRERERERERESKRSRQGEKESALWRRGYRIQANENRSQASMVLVVVVLFWRS